MKKILVSLFVALFAASTLLAQTPEEIVADQDELVRLRCALNQLTPEEWMLVNALYYRNMSEAEAGKFLGITQQAVSYRIKSICRKLKKIMRI